MSSCWYVLLRPCMRLRYVLTALVSCSSLERWDVFTSSSMDSTNPFNFCPKLPSPAAVTHSYSTLQDSSNISLYENTATQEATIKTVTMCLLACTHTETSWTESCVMADMNWNAMLFCCFALLGAWDIIIQIQYNRVYQSSQ